MNHRPKSKILKYEAFRRKPRISLWPWVRQRFLDFKSTIHKKSKLIKWTLPKSKTSALQKTMLREGKNKLLTGRVNLQIRSYKKFVSRIYKELTKLGYNKTSIFLNGHKI